MADCLDGIRVLELARYQAGPRGGMILSDLGAEVIKLEKPGGEETRKSPPMVNGQSVYFSVYNRGPGAHAGPAHRRDPRRAPGLRRGPDRRAPCHAGGVGGR